MAGRTNALRRSKYIRALPAYEEPPAKPGGDYFFVCSKGNSPRSISSTIGGPFSQCPFLLVQFTSAEAAGIFIAHKIAQKVCVEVI